MSDYKERLKEIADNTFRGNSKWRNSMFDLMVTVYEWGLQDGQRQAVRSIEDVMDKAKAARSTV